MLKNGTLKIGHLKIALHKNGCEVKVKEDAKIKVTKWRDKIEVRTNKMLLEVYRHGFDFTCKKGYIALYPGKERRFGKIAGTVFCLGHLRLDINL